MCQDCLLDPKMDFIFKRIFGNEKQPQILIRFLNAILEAKDTSGNYDPIVWIEFKNTEIPKDSNDSKASILDIKARTSNEELINIEIQRNDEGNMLERALFYLCRMFTEQLGSGGRYETLERTVSIVITDYVTDFIKSSHFHNTHQLFNGDTNDMLTNLLELHFIELPKMEKFDENDVLQLFLQFLKDPQDATVEEKSTQVTELSHAKAELKRLSIDPKMRYEQELRERTLKDMNSALSNREKRGIQQGMKLGLEKGVKQGVKKGIKQGREEGIKKGREEGIKKGIEETKLENAKNLLDVLDDETIAKKIGLDVSSVTKLRFDTNK